MLFSIGDFNAVSLIFLHGFVCGENALNRFEEAALFDWLIRAFRFFVTSAGDDLSFELLSRSGNVLMYFLKISPLTIKSQNIQALLLIGVLSI